MQLSAYFNRFSGRGSLDAKPTKGLCNLPNKKHILFFEGTRNYTGRNGFSPSSYTLAATLAAIWAEIFLILVNGGQIIPFSQFSFVTCPAKPSAAKTKNKRVIKYTAKKSASQCTHSFFWVVYQSTHLSCPLQSCDSTGPVLCFAIFFTQVIAHQKLPVFVVQLSGSTSQTIYVPYILNGDLLDI